MKKKNKKTDKPGNTDDLPIPVSPASSGPRSLANNPWVHIAFVIFLIAIVYSNTLNAPFQWDERMFIVDNPILKDLHYFVHPSDAKGFELYGHLMERYIGYFTFALNYKMHGFSVTGYHIVNIAIHVANSILVYLLVLLTFRTPFMGISSMKQHSQYVAFFSSLLFGVHPLQTMAVTYVMQRFVPLAVMFSLLSLTAYVQSRLTGDKKQRILFYCISFVSAVLAMKTKEIAFTLPVLATVYEFLFFRGTLKKRLLYLAPMLLTMSIVPLTLIYLKRTIIVGKQHLPGVTYAVLSRGDYLLTEFRVIVTYLRLLFFPVNQNIAYDYPVFNSFFSLQVLPAFLLLAVLLGTGVWMLWKAGKQPTACPVRPEKGGREREPSEGKFAAHDLYPLRLMGYGILWFFVTLSVESSIIPLDRTIDEYRMYLPSVGLIVCVATGVFLLKERMQSIKAGSVLIVLIVLVSGVLAIAAYKRNYVWGDNIGLWEDTVKKSPTRASVHNNLGNMYRNRNMFDKALEQYLIAVKLNPDYAEAYTNLGNIYLALNMPDKVINEYLTAIKLKPNSAEAHYDLGVFYQDQNMTDKAIEQYLTAIQLKPDYMEAHDNLGNIYQVLSMPDKAVEQYLTAIKLTPGNAMAHFNLGVLYYRMGQMENAQRELTAGLKMKPDDQRAQQLLRELAR